MVTCGDFMAYHLELCLAVFMTVLTALYKTAISHLVSKMEVFLLVAERQSLFFKPA